MILATDTFGEEERYRAFQVGYSEWDINTQKTTPRSKKTKRNPHEMEPVFDSPFHSIRVADIVIEKKRETPKVDGFWLKHVK